MPVEQWTLPAGTGLLIGATSVSALSEDARAALSRAVAAVPAILEAHVPQVAVGRGIHRAKYWSLLSRTCAALMEPCRSSGRSLVRYSLLTCSWTCGQCLRETIYSPLFANRAVKSWDHRPRVDERGGAFGAKVLPNNTYLDSSVKRKIKSSHKRVSVRGHR